MASDSDSGHDSDEADLETEWLFPSGSRSDPAEHAGRSSTAGTKADADRIAAFDEAVFGADNSGAFRPDPATEEAPTRVPGEPLQRASEGPREPRQYRKRVLLIVAAVVVLFLVVAAVGVVAAIRRDGGVKSSPGVPAVRSQASTSTASRAPVTPTIAQTVTSGAPSTSFPTPTPFTVRANCAGRDCAVAVREAPSASARQVASLRTGQIVQVNCSTHGDSVDDSDTGRRSDVWYRFADTNGYSSALYLEGPTVADCG